MGGLAMMTADKISAICIAIAYVIAIIHTIRVARRELR